MNIDMVIVLRVYDNLLANAVRFAKEKITVSAESQDGYLYLTVSDDGVGFAEKDLENGHRQLHSKAVAESFSLTLWCFFVTMQASTCRRA